MEKRQQGMIAVHGGFIIKSAREVVHDAYVVTSQGRITQITTTRPHGCEIIGGPHDIVMPGLINMHTHAPMTLFRGLADDLPLMKWWREHIFPAELKFMNPEMVYLGGKLAAWEMLRSGTTAFCDGYFFEDDAARAFAEAGIRAWIAEGLVGAPTPSIPDPAQALGHIREFITRWQAAPLITPTVFAHAVYSCPPELIRAGYALAQEYDIPFQIHVSETRQEVRQCRARYGMSPVELLDSLEVLSPRTIASHCVALNPGEIELLARRGVCVAHNAESNMKMGSGIAPAPAMLKAGITVGIGTDGCASNNNLDLIGEMSSVALLHKVHTRNPSVMDAPTVFAMATEKAARALGLAGGRLEEGLVADIVVLDGQRPNLVPVYNPVSHVVYAATGADVKHVLVDGKIVVRDAICRTIDEQALLAQCRLAQHKIAPR